MNWMRFQKATAEYGQLAAEQYNMIVTENRCKMKYIAKSYTELDFTRCDYLVDYAKRSYQQIRMHVLVWGSPNHNPQFVEDETDKVKLEKFMIEFITKTMERYGDYPIAYDVVNEAIDNADSKYIKVSPWT